MYRYQVLETKKVMEWARGTGKDLYVEMWWSIILLKNHGTSAEIMYLWH
jgi:hypothetical protein